MRSLRELSVRTDSAEQLADWVEISAFLCDDKSVSKEDLARALVREGSNQGEQLYRDKATEAFDELAAREAAVGNSISVDPIAAYPFEIDGDLLRLRVDPFDEHGRGAVYAFLLAATRASMDSRTRKLANLDPTVLFEMICAEALCQFWGGRSAVSDVLVTGTSNQSLPAGNARFPSIIESLSGQIREGGGWKKGARSPGAGDGGLDIAVWRRFHDRRPGSLVGFAQCKTGDNWRDHLGKRNPSSISCKYFSSPLVIAPVPIYMVPCRVGLEEWADVMRQHSGLLFDRCRITTCCTHLPHQRIGECQRWAHAAIRRELDELISKKLVPPSSGGTVKMTR